MSTVNVNIKNCNCSGGSGAGTGTGTGTGNDVFDGEPAVSVDTPPSGYAQSAVSDRACKTAVWIYDWVHNWVDFMAGSAFVLTNILILAAGRTIGQVVIRPVARAIGSVIGAVAALTGTPGLTADDPVTVLIAGTTAEFLVDSAIEYGANELTQAMIEVSVSTLEDNRDGFICAIASGGNPNAAASNLETLLAAEFPSPVQWLIFNLSQVFLNLAYFSANWWPGFEDEIAGITETCCGGLVNGNPIEAGSAQACTGANFILDNLVGVLTTADSYVQNYSRTTYNSVTATESLMLSNVQSTFTVPANVQSKAFSWGLMQAELARYMWAKLGGDSWLTPGPGVNTWEMGRLGAHLQTEIAICELRDAATAQAAYELLSGAIDAWLTANVTAQDLSSHIRLFCQGLIHPSGAYIGVLFAESADLAGFSGSSDCAECDDTCHGELLYGVDFIDNNDYLSLSTISTGNGYLLAVKFVDENSNPCGKYGTISVISGDIDSNNGYCSAYVIRQDSVLVGSPGQSKSFAELNQWLNSMSEKIHKIDVAYNDTPVRIRLTYD